MKILTLGSVNLDESCSNCGQQAMCIRFHSYT